MEILLLTALIVLVTTMARHGDPTRFLPTVQIDITS